MFIRSQDGTKIYRVETLVYELSETVGSLCMKEKIRQQVWDKYGISDYTSVDTVEKAEREIQAKLSYLTTTYDYKILVNGEVFGTFKDNNRGKQVFEQIWDNMMYNGAETMQMPEE